MLEGCNQHFENPRSEDYTDLEEKLQSLRVTPSDFLMFPHMCEWFVNEDGNDILSHMILLPSGTEKDQLSFEVTGKLKQFNLHYAYPEAMMQKETIELACNMHVDCAKVTVFQKLFATLKQKLKGEQKKLKMEITLPFECESEPIYVNINYFAKPTNQQGDTHLLYILMIDFKAKKQFREKTTIGGFRFFASP